MSFPPEPYVYAPLHGMNTIFRMFVLGNFCCAQECMQNDRDSFRWRFIPLTRSFKLWRVQVFPIKIRVCNTPELKIRRKIARTLE